MVSDAWALVALFVEEAFLGCMGLALALLLYLIILFRRQQLQSSRNLSGPAGCPLSRIKQAAS